MQNFITPFRSQICENAHQVTRLGFWFFCQPTKTPAPIFTVDTSNNVVSFKGVPFEGLENKILYFDPTFPKKIGPFLAGQKILTQKGLNYGDATKLPLIVII